MKRTRTGTSLVALRCQNRERNRLGVIEKPKPRHCEFGLAPEPQKGQGCREPAIDLDEPGRRRRQNGDARETAQPGHETPEKTSTTITDLPDEHSLTVDLQNDVPL